MSAKYDESNWKKMADEHVTPPPPEVWSRIEVTMKNKRKRPFFLWLIFIGLGLSLLTFAMVNYESGVNKFTGTDSQSKSETAHFQNHMTEIKSISTKPDNNVSPSKEKSHEDITIASMQRSSNFKHYTNTKIVSNNENAASKENTTPEQYESTESTNAISQNVSSKNETGDKQAMESTNVSINLALTIPYMPMIQSKCVNQDEVKISKTTECPTFKSRRNTHYFFESAASLGYHSQSMIAIENTKLASLRKQTESEWYNWGFAIRGGVYLSPALSIGTGVEYVQLKDRFNFIQSKVTKLTITYDAVTGQALDTSLVKGTTINKGENRYNLINIPLILRYEKHIQSWKLGIDGSILINAHFTNRGKMYNDELNVSKFANDATVYKNGLGFGYQLGAMLSKRINIGTDVFMRPSFTTFGKNWTIGGYDPATSYTMFRCEIGLRWVL